MPQLHPAAGTVNVFATTAPVAEWHNRPDCPPSFVTPGAQCVPARVVVYGDGRLGWGRLDWARVLPELSASELAVRLGCSKRRARQLRAQVATEHRPRGGLREALARSQLREVAALWLTNRRGQYRAVRPCGGRYRYDQWRRVGAGQLFPDGVAVGVCGGRALRASAYRWAVMGESRLRELETARAGLVRVEV